MMKDMVGLVAWQILIIHYRHKELWKMKSLYNVISRQKIPKVLRFLLHSDISFAFWPLFILIIWLAVTYIKKKKKFCSRLQLPEPLWSEGMWKLWCNSWDSYYPEAKVKMSQCFSSPWWKSSMFSWYECQ